MFGFFAVGFYCLPNNTRKKRSVMVGLKNHWSIWSIPCGVFLCASTINIFVFVCEKLGNGSLLQVYLMQSIKSCRINERMSERLSAHVESSQGSFWCNVSRNNESSSHLIIWLWKFAWKMWTYKLYRYKKPKMYTKYERASI